VLWSPSPTTVRVVSSRDPSYINHPVTLRATVSTVGGRPTGTVSFYDGSILLGTSAVHRGKATFTTSSLALGSNDITAEYAGNTNFEGSTSADLVQTVTTRTR
jgi:hypothetical protein